MSESAAIDQILTDAVDQWASGEADDRAPTASEILSEDS
jgi:hypothetical protein